MRSDLIADLEEILCITSRALAKANREEREAKKMRATLRLVDFMEDGSMKKREPLPRGVRPFKNGFQARRTIKGVSYAALGKTPGEALDLLNKRIDLAAASETAYTLQHLLDDFVDYQTAYVSKATIANYDIAIRLHIPEALKAKPATEISAAELREILKAVSYSRTRKSVYSLLNSAFRFGCDEGKLAVNVMTAVKPIRHEYTNGKPLTVDEQKEFLTRIHGHSVEQLMKFYLLTGCRREEALNIHWSDVDIKNNCIHIAGTKTKTSDRYIPIFPELKLLLADLPHSGDTLFVYNTEYVSRAFKRLCPQHKLHDLRHTFATRCLECGIPLRVVQSWLGHSSVKITADLYTHVLDDFQRQEATKFKLFDD